MIDGRTFRRGDVLLASMPLITNPREQKVRPVVIIQNDMGNRFSSNLIVALITSRLPRRSYPTNVILRRGSPEAEGTGLNRDSAIQTEVISTIPKSLVRQSLGRLSETAMEKLDACLKVSLSLPCD